MVIVPLRILMEVSASLKNVRSESSSFLGFPQLGQLRLQEAPQLVESLGFLDPESLVFRRIFGRHIGILEEPDLYAREHFLLAFVRSGFHPPPSTILNSGLP